MKKYNEEDVSDKPVGDTLGTIAQHIIYFGTLAANISFRLYFDYILVIFWIIFELYFDDFFILIIFW